MYMVGDIHIQTLYPEGQTLGANPKIPRGHTQKGDTILFWNFEIVLAAYESHMIVEHKT